MTNSEVLRIMSVYDAVHRYQLDCYMRTDALFRNVTRIADCTLDDLHRAMDIHHARPRAA